MSCVPRSFPKDRACLCRYELFIDDLPVWGFVGPPPEETKDDDNIYVYTHKAFDVNYNDNRVGPDAMLWHHLRTPPVANV